MEVILKELRNTFKFGPVEANNFKYLGIMIKEKVDRTIMNQ